MRFGGGVLAEAGANHIEEMADDVVDECCFGIAFLALDEVEEAAVGSTTLGLVERGLRTPLSSRCRPIL